MAGLKLKSQCQAVVNTDEIQEVDANGEAGELRIYFKDKRTGRYSYADTNVRDDDRAKLDALVLGSKSTTSVAKTGESMLLSMKEYFNKHRDIVFTLGLVILVDHFLFDGMLREKIKQTVEGLLDRINKQA